MLRTDHKERQAFLMHRWVATKRRKIEFLFTYDEWIAWWEKNLGPNWFALRGTASESYVMARYGDKGPYAPWNVKCITMAENSNEALRGKQCGNAKLTKNDVCNIWLELKKNKSVKKLSHDFGVCESTIRDIKKKYTWSKLTDLLD